MCFAENAWEIVHKGLWRIDANQSFQKYPAAYYILCRHDKV